MDWNAEWYENKHGFVAEYGRELLSCVPENPEQSILDLGCGTGTLTHALLEKSASVTGLDSSPEMIAKARRLYPGMDFRVLDARLMPWRNRFDIVFSNAALHWIPDHGTLLNAVSRVLKPQGKLVCEFRSPPQYSPHQGSFSDSPGTQEPPVHNAFLLSRRGRIRQRAGTSRAPPGNHEGI